MNTRIIRTGLSLLGVLGIGITSWISVRCSKKADEKETTLDKVKTYAPAIASGVATAACVMGANHIGNREIAALTAGAAYMAEHRDKLPDGKRTQQSLESGRNKDIAPWEGPSIEWTGNGNLLCFEAYSGRLFYSSEEAIRRAEDELNERFVGGEYVSLNTFYELLNIEKTIFGAEFGWAANADYYDGPIEFIHITDKSKHGEKMLIIDIYTRPMECWEQV